MWETFFKKNRNAKIKKNVDIYMNIFLCKRGKWLIKCRAISSSHL